MGCGRSTMGSDSPSRNSKQDEDWNEGSGTQPSQKGSATQNANPSGAKTLPFNHGGALLAQAKISGSQLDFFKSLDEKIENGPDYNDSDDGDETDDDEGKLLRKSRLKFYLQQWNQLTQAKKNQGDSKDRKHPDSVPLIRSTPKDSLQLPGAVDDSGNSLSSSDEEIEAMAKESVKEQYVFMGSLYTLTRLRSDGTYIPRVDVSPAHKGLRESGSATREVTSAKVEGKPNNKPIDLPADDHSWHEDTSVSVKANGSLLKLGENIDSIQFPSALTPEERAPLRPASLALRNVFPNVGGGP